MAFQEEADIVNKLWSVVVASWTDEELLELWKHAKETKE